MAEQQSLSEVAKAINLLSISLLPSLSGTPSSTGNIFCSPWSLSCALAMTYAGAKGQTATQLEKALHFTMSMKSNNVHEMMKEINQHLKNLSTENNKIKVANRLWIQSGFSILDNFLETVRKGYEIESGLVNFADAETTSTAINNWVEKNTNGKIKNLIDPSMIDSLTRLVITNAVYFKGQWKTQFNANLTRSLPFHINSSEDIKVQMMYMKAKRNFYYTETNDVQILGLPYHGENMRMLIVLPRKYDGVSFLESTLTARPSVLSSWFDAQPVHCEIEMTIPKFKITHFIGNLKSIFQSLGMVDLFSAKDADLSGITGSRDLYVSDIVQKAFVEVNEVGTEAAAATAVVMRMTRCAPMPEEPPLEFHADHPFLFFIVDCNTNVILFMGKVANPKST